MTSRLFTLQRWADRAPARRYPLLLLALLVLFGLAGGITGCGGGDEDEARPTERIGPRCVQPIDPADPSAPPASCGWGQP